MNNDQVGSAVRSIVLFFLGLFSVKLGIDAATSTSIAAAVAALAVAGYGMWIKRNSAASPTQ